MQGPERGDRRIMGRARGAGLHGHAAAGGGERKAWRAGLSAAHRRRAQSFGRAAAVADRPRALPAASLEPRCARHRRLFRRAVPIAHPRARQLDAAS